VKLWFGTGFKPQIELTSMGDNLVHDGLHLVDLDGIDDIAFSLEVIFLLRLLIALSHLLDAIVEDVGETQQHRWGHIAQGKLIHHIAQIDLRIILTRCDIDITLIVDTEVRSTPSIDIVQLFGVFYGPFFHLIGVVILWQAHGKPSCCFN